MNRKLYIGVIGAGMIGDVHIDCIHKDGRAEVTWIASRKEKTLRLKREKFGIPNSTTDYRECLNDPSLDAVVIASPPYTHLRMIKDALRKGKHILLEKPMVVNRSELGALQDAVAQNPDPIILECSCRHARLQPKYRFIKQMIDSGELGEVYHIHHQRLTRQTFIEYNPAGAWAHQKILAGGGPFMDWGVYDLSFHLGLLDDKPQIRSVQAFTRNHLKPFQDSSFVSDIEEHGAAWMVYDTGLTYYYERGSGVQFEAPNRTRIHGTKGSLHFGFCSWDPAELTYFYSHNGQEKQTILNVPMSVDHDDNLALIQHFLDVLIKGVAPQMTVDLASKHLDILFRILE
jgi:predicted dehydrogenase